VKNGVILRIRHQLLGILLLLLSFQIFSPKANTSTAYLNDISLGEICPHRNTTQTFMIWISDYKTSKTSFIDAYNQFIGFLIRSVTLIMLISYGA